MAGSNLTSNAGNTVAAPGLRASWSDALPLPAFLNAGNHKPVDPYLIWAEISQYASFGGAAPHFVGVLYERQGQVPCNGSNEVGKLIDKIHSANPLNDQSRFGTAHVPHAALRELTAAVKCGQLRRFQLCSPRIAHTAPAPAMAASWARISQRTAVMPGANPEQCYVVAGIVDDGCCIAHETFRTQGHTRFAFVWDQNPCAQVESPWTHTSDAGYGAQLSWPEINALLARFPALGELEERKFYAAVGRPEWGSLGRKHGAGVTQVFAGSCLRALGDESASWAPPIVFVQMPDATVADTSGGSLGLYVLDGARYIVRRARELALASGQDDWKAIINLSVGSIAGAHDGTSIAEEALAELTTDSSVQLVVAAGNAADWNTHAIQRVSQQTPGRFFVMVPPDCSRETYIEIWLPEKDDDGQSLDLATVGVHVIEPKGQASGVVQGGELRSFAASGSASASIIFPRRVCQATSGTMILAVVRPTSESSGNAGSAPPYGIWTLELTTSNASPITVHGWVERNDIIVGSRAPQQSCFVNDDRDYVTSSMTLGSIANNDRLIVAGAYRVTDQAITDYSGRGPTRLPDTRAGPDYFGPADNSPFLPGMQIPGFFSGSYTRASGTSIAAPFVARWLAQGSPHGALTQGSQYGHPSTDGPPDLRVIRRE